jgi:hypothetical protein
MERLLKCLGSVIQQLEPETADKRKASDNAEKKIGKVEEAAPVVQGSMSRAAFLQVWKRMIQ